ncbi:MAG: hypothetical protein V1696_00550 [Candidatus Jorgensenbacteria bacterium]
MTRLFETAAGEAVISLKGAMGIILSLVSSSEANDHGMAEWIKSNPLAEVTLRALPAFCSFHRENGMPGSYLQGPDIQIKKGKTELGTFRWNGTWTESRWVEIDLPHVLSVKSPDRVFDEKTTVQIRWDSATGKVSTFLSSLVKEE